MTLLCSSSRDGGDGPDGLDVESQMVLLGWSSRGIGDAVDVEL